MAGYHTVRDADILAEAGRGGFQGDAVVVAIGYDAPDDDVVTAIDVERVIIVVVAIEHLDAVDTHTVAGQIMLHPAARVPERDIFDGDVLTLDEADEVGAGDALVVPGEFLEGAPLSVNGSKAINHYVFHVVGINQLDG